MIVARALGKKLGSVKAVWGADLEVTQGETVVLFGPNGAGKSTLLRLVAGLLRPTAGRVELNDQPPRAAKGNIGYLGHETYLYPYLTAAENLEFYSCLYSVSPSRGFELMDLLGLTPKTNALAGRLSQGEGRRLALCRAMLHDPDYLLLDEPFSNLDTDSADKLSALIRRPGRSILLATHDHERGSSLADRTIRIEGGRVS